MRHRYNIDTPARPPRSSGSVQSEVYERSTRAAANLRLEVAEVVGQQQLRARMDETGDAGIVFLSEERVQWQQAAMRARQEEAAARVCEPHVL